MSNTDIPLLKSTYYGNNHSKEYSFKVWIQNECYAFGNLIAC